MKKYNKFDLLNYNSYRIKAIAENAYLPENTDDILNLLSSLENYYLIGNGSNIILSKPIYEEDFIIIRENLSNIDVSNNEIYVESGAILKDVADIARENELSGMEMFYDIPGTIGGAVVMNAGACGEAISDLIEDVFFVDIQTRKMGKVKKDELKWGYRKSEFQNGEKIITGASLKLKKGNKLDIIKKTAEIIEKRHSMQPWDMPSAGSVFKRPEGHYVGKMVEELGLKGYRIGGMKISEKHAGFIVNCGNGTGEDVLKIVDFVKAKVKEKYNITLELEQIII